MPFQSSMPNADAEEDHSEREPLIPNSHPTLNNSTARVNQSNTVRFKVILPVLMSSVFLAAFDLTVVAAIYPIMYTSENEFILS